MSKNIQPYKCAFSINHSLLNLTCDIAYKAGVLENEGFFPNPEDKISGVKTIVELKGGHLTPSQFKGLANGERLPNNEVANAFASIYQRLARLDPFDESFIQLFEESYFIEGVPNRMGRKAEDFPFPLPLTPRIAPMMKGLFSFLKGSIGKTHPLILSGMAYVEILSIAPYSKGNEALALLLSKAILTRYTKTFLYLPLEENLHKKRDLLYKAIEEGSERADLSGFLLVYLEVLSASLRSLSLRREKKNKETSAQVKRLLAVMEEGKFYGANELCEMLGLKSRLGLMKNYINPALASHLIKRSDPTSPTSRNQRYGKVKKDEE